MEQSKEQMTIVIVGHVDHGKSTVIGRLLADTGSLPQGKLEQVKAHCLRTSRPFEYAFLLDALKDEQAQGITIDAARCFFKTQKRHYLVFDAPGHIEFLKNMVSGAAHAEAALLVIDAKEGIQENSKRHGYLLSMLGVRQVTVLVNKMDLVNYDEKVFESIRKEYSAFLGAQGVVPTSFVPIAALHGDNIAERSKEMLWYKGPTALEQLDAFQNKKSAVELPFRFPVQDIYKFTAEGDERRLAAGTVDSGSISSGEEVVFLPSFKKTRIASIERFSAPERREAHAGEAIGFTFETQLYVRPGEIMVRASGPQPKVSTRLRANIFWMGHASLVKGKSYKLKLATSRVQARLVDIVRVLDAAELKGAQDKKEVERHDVAEIILETARPVAFDVITDNEGTGRFVLVDNYEIAGGGIILEACSEDDTLFKKEIRERETMWHKGAVTKKEREETAGHSPKFVVICGDAHVGKKKLASELEHQLFHSGCQAYYLGISNLARGLAADLKTADAEEHIRRLGEVARIITDAGFIFITTIPDVDDHDIDKLRFLNSPAEIVVVTLGGHVFGKFTPDIEFPANPDTGDAVARIIVLLKDRNILAADYVI
ncbi:MAG: adenylyl-sulfate kinase [Candidatus Omnitrophica bacterium]|nr:adenylyl-sulfate kinase [Candidatus Omnitrophota bacterium]